MPDDAAKREDQDRPEPPAEPVEDASEPRAEPERGGSVPEREGAAHYAESNDGASARVRRRWPVVLAWCVALASLFGPIAASGIWDPYELRVADLSRRIAVSLLGAEELAIEGSENSVATASELGRGELPFTSVALGFKLFGLSEWAGRLPLGLWGLAGLGALYLLVARLGDRIGAAFSVLALATTPLYFLHARTILGEVVVMAGLAMATAGLALAVFDSRASSVQRAAFWVLGLLGLAAGFGGRGVLLGVALPTLAVGLAWLFCRSSGTRGWAGALVLLVGACAGTLGIWFLLRADEQEFSRLLGSAVSPPRKLPTHDWVILHLGHALLPYSAVVPIVMGQLIRPPEGVGDEQRTREIQLRLVVSLAAILGLGFYGASAARVGELAFGPVFALAAIVGLAFREIDRTGKYSITMAFGIAALAVLFYTDFKNFPEKGLSPFVVSGATFPDSFKERATQIVKYSMVIGSAVLVFVLAEPPSSERIPLSRRDYATWLATLRKAYSGNLLYGVGVAAVALVGFSILTVLSDRRFHWQQFERMGLPWRMLAKYGYIALPLVVAAPWLLMLARDAARLFFRNVPVTRGAVSLLALTAMGATLSFGYYPALASQLSPKEVFQSYRDLAKPGEELAMMGVGGGSATYYAGREVKNLPNVNEAFEWLSDPAASRRWIVVRSTDIAKLNSLYRGRFKKNLPVLDGHSSEILLVSNRLNEGEENQNPFKDWVLDERPIPAHELDANFGDQLEALGWEITDLEGEAVDTVRPGKRYQFRLYYEVLRPISGDWETFIHIDGYQRRFNGDHETLKGKYPFQLWKTGDFIADIHEFELEPNFTPGTYQAYFGLFKGNRRLDVKRGHHQEDRVFAGPVVVR